MGNIKFLNVWNFNVWLSKFLSISNCTVGFIYYWYYFLPRGAGCIFVEMITGIALFPGMRDYIDQLNKIWQVTINSNS